MSEKEVNPTPTVEETPANPYKELLAKFQSMESDFRKAFEGEQRAAKRRVRKSLSLFAKDCKVIRSGIDTTRAEKELKA